MRRAASEIRRAVDRIDDPGRSALAYGAGLALLADEPVARKYPEEALGDQRLRLPIHFGQIVLGALKADRERLVEETSSRQYAGLARNRLRREQPHLHERRSAFDHLNPCQKWLYAPRSKTTELPSGPMNFGGRRPSTASPTNVNGTSAAAAANSKAAADSRGAEARSS